MPTQIFRNNLLNSLSADDVALIRPELEAISLNLEDRVIEPRVVIEHVHFVESGLLSVVIDPGTKNEIEVGLIGSDGFSGTPLLFGSAETPFRVFVQRPGQAYRMSAQIFRDACDRSRTFERALLRYAQSFLVQIAESARSNGRFTVEQRLARWLLLSHDRGDSDEILMTHEFLATMLGVRRPGITVATHVLEGAHLIRAKRGSIRILDRPGLEKAAGGSYGLARDEHARLFPADAPVHGAVPVSLAVV